MTYLAYLVSTDESATILDEPLFTVEEIPEEISDKTIYDMVVHLLTTNNEKLPETVVTGEEALKWMREEAIYYSENLIVFVEDDGKIIPRLKRIAKRLYGTMGDDSSCYAAAENWADIVIAHGEENTFPI